MLNDVRRVADVEHARGDRHALSVANDGADLRQPSPGERPELGFNRAARCASPPEGIAKISRTATDVEDAPTLKRCVLVDEGRRVGCQVRVERTVDRHAQHGTS